MIKKTIANSFNKYIVNIGITLASGLNDAPESSHTNYLIQIHFFFILNIDEDTL